MEKGTRDHLVQRGSAQPLQPPGTGGLRGPRLSPGLLLGSPCVPHRPCPAWARTQLCTQTASLKINQGSIFTFGKRMKKEEEHSSSAGEGCGSWFLFIPSPQGRLLADRVPEKYLACP